MYWDRLGAQERCQSFDLVDPVLTLGNTDGCQLLSVSRSFYFLFAHHFHFPIPKEHGTSTSSVYQPKVAELGIADVGSWSGVSAQTLEWMVTK